MLSFIRTLVSLCIPMLVLGGCIVPVAYTPNLCREMRAVDMLQLHFMFGLTEPDDHPVSEADWNDFLAHEITPRFPTGLTVLDTTGQWLDTQTRTVTHEPSRIIWISTAPRQSLQHDIMAIREAYKTRFHQQSVGLTIESSCASF